MATIYQGDQYALPFKMTVGGQAITPQNCDGVRFAVGGIVQSYPDGGLTYDSESGQWLFQLTAEATANLQGDVPCQVEVKTDGGAIRRHSAVKQVDVLKSIIKGGWSA